MVLHEGARVKEVRSLIDRLVMAGLDPVEAAEIVTRAAIAGIAEASRSSGAVRQERYRRNKASQTVTGDASDDGASPPRQESPRTPKETQPTLPTTHKENPPKGGQKKAARLPSDWLLPDGWALDAIEAGLPANHIDLEAAKMRDWSLSSKNGAKLDWRAVWRNWCREAAARLPQNRAPPRRPVDDLIGSMLTRMDLADANATTEIEGYSQALGRLPGH